MIQPNELRIGNRINYSGSYAFNGVFDEAFAKYILDVGDEWGLLNPVPLTEEWLMELGFNNGEKTIYGDQIIKIIANEFFLYGPDSATPGQSFFGKIEFVHQLQNLYFALTGEELEVKQ